nr:S-adenosylmethionine:tRNA ribosyltransferase-isomerase [Candidatus Dojkabacteria bacterium]
MKMSEFKYILPEDRISKYPPKRRGTTKLLVLDRSNGHILHKKYPDCVEYINKGDVVVINDTKVEKRRTFFHDSKGRLFEILFLNKQKEGNWFALIKKNKLLKEGIVLINEREQSIQVRIKEKKENGRVVELLSPFSEEEIFQKIGHTPIPPYMKRLDTKED